jgi:hypothetical protein
MAGVEGQRAKGKKHKRTPQSSSYNRPTHPLPQVVLTIDDRSHHMTASYALPYAAQISQFEIRNSKFLPAYDDLVINPLNALN